MVDRTVDQVRDRLSVAARTMILMTETMGYMADSLDPLVLQPVPPPADLGGRELHRILNNDYMINNLQKRVRDLQKNIRGAQHFSLPLPPAPAVSAPPYPPTLTLLGPSRASAGCLKELQNLGTMTEVINTRQLEDVYKGVEKNTKALVDAAASTERAAASLEVMQRGFAASMAFDLIDKVTGLDLNIEFAGWQLWICEMAQTPGLWMLVNWGFCFLLVFALGAFMKNLKEKTLNFLSFEVLFNTKLDPLALKDYLDTKDLEVSDGQIRDGGQMTKSAIWDEDDEMIWEGAAPNLEIKYDAINGQRPCPSCSPFLVAVCCLVAGLLTRLDRFAGFLLTAQFNIDKKLSNKSEIELQIIFMEQLAGAGVVDWAVIDRFNETNLWEETE